MQIKVITTKDGSKSLFLTEMNETYHSKFGAKTESEHVFIKSGFKVIDLPEIHILEIGFGTGLNALLTVLAAQKTHRKVYYESLEKYPLPDEIISQINDFTDTEMKEIFTKLHTTPWQKTLEIFPGFSLLKNHTDLLNYQSTRHFHLIYFDAFAPDKQPEMWTQEIFDKMFSLLAPQGILVTYSAKGLVRRRMQAAGFAVSRLPGPPGKREMLRAVKPEE